MRIERFNHNISDMEELKQKQLAKRERNGKSNGSVVQEETSVESQAVSIELKVKEQVKLESVSEEKVQQIKKAISSGDYVVDIHKVSSAMIKEMLGL